MMYSFGMSTPSREYRREYQARENEIAERRKYRAELVKLKAALRIHLDCLKAVGVDGCCFGATAEYADGYATAQAAEIEFLEGLLNA